VSFKLVDSLALLSLPNSGSTWFAQQIAEHTDWNRYRMEFFNPLRNPKHYSRLAQHFGCELISCYSNIATGDCHGIDADIRATWGEEDYNFTKEVFSPFKLPVFARNFRCVVLLRAEEDSFPPDRARIWSFYEHAWYALCEAGIKLRGDTVEERARSAAACMSRRLEADARALEIPVIHYRDLFNDGMLRTTLQGALGECTDELYASIRETRKMRDRLVA
jgi:hypothetical protein